MYFSRFKSPLYSLLLKLLMISVAFSMIWLDIAVFHTEILEISFTEITQEVMLFICAILFWCSNTKAQRTGFNYLTAGFFGCLWVRELDGLFDPISHSAWCWPFMAIALWATYSALKPTARRQTLSRLESFATSQAFATISTGVAILLFSRVFGMGTFWHLVLGPNYARLAKTTVEEGTELLAYSMWFAASIEYFFQERLATAHLSHQGQRHEKHGFRHSIGRGGGVGNIV